MKCDEQFLNQCRNEGDSQADKLIADVFREGGQSTMYQLLKRKEGEIYKTAESPARTFLLSRKEVPVWLDLKSLARGQRLFEQYALEIMTLLGVMALPYCYAGSPGNKALYLSDKMRNAPGKRLMDTAAFVIAVLTPGNLHANHSGHTHINKVRLIHALSRYYLKQHSDWRMEWGMPINQEDLAGTNLAFSYIILSGMQQSGIVLSQKEKEDFILTWRYIGYLLNINEEVLPSSFSEAARLTYIIKKRNFRKTEEGVALTSELLNYYKASVAPLQAELASSQIRFYVGNEIAEYIGLVADPVRDSVTSFLSNFHSLKKMLTSSNPTYREMLSQHSLMKKKIGTR
jgi:hypothetical protein